MLAAEFVISFNSLPVLNIFLLFESILVSFYFIQKGRQVTFKGEWAKILKNGISTITLMLRPGLAVEEENKLQN